MKRVISVLVALVAAVVALAPVAARQAATPPTGANPRVITDVSLLAEIARNTTLVPSLSIAVVTDGTISTAAVGEASYDPKRSASPNMRYSIGSVSKQFTAAAVLMLAEQGKLALDDKVGRFIPTLTRANDVTVRQLLSHTSGYQDYWPQDYVPPFMLQPVTAEQILDRWARKPLDFEPGAQWQYSNTGYVIAGLIVEKAAGVPLFTFLRDRIFKPLGMQSVVDVDRGRLTEPDPIGYMRYGLGPLRPAPKEGAGWLFAAGELAMTASDLARWNISVIDQKLMTPASYRAMATETLLNNGQSTRYGLGVRVISDQGRRGLEHGGEVSGFTAENVIYPDDRAAVTVLTNQDAVGAAADLGRRISPYLFRSPADAEALKALATVRGIFEGLQQGKLDRSLFTANCNAYFTDQAIEDMAAFLPHTAPSAFTQTSRSERGGMTYRAYQLQYGERTIIITVRIMSDGKVEQYQIARGA